VGREDVENFWLVLFVTEYIEVRDSTLIGLFEEGFMNSKVRGIT
jgi:hypothetical protein